MSGQGIQRLLLRNFRSYESANLSLDNPLFLVGRNGSGKSNLLDAFDFLADAMSFPLHIAFGSRGGISKVRWRNPEGGAPPNLAIGIHIRASFPRHSLEKDSYSFEIRAEKEYGYRVVREQCIVHRQSGNSRWDFERMYFDRSDGDLQTNIEGLSLSLEPTTLVLPLVGGLDGFSSLVQSLRNMRTYAFSSDMLRHPQDPDLGEILRTNASNAASVLEEIAMRSPEDLVRIGELLEAAVPQVSSVKPTRQGKRLSFEFSQVLEKRSLGFDPYDVSEGTLRLFGILLAAFQNQRPSLIGIEEPELSLHPGVIGVLLDVLAMMAKRSQLIVTTQSPEVLDSDLVTESNLRLVEWGNGSSRLLPLRDTSKRFLREHLMGAGEMLRANQLMAGSPRTSPPKMFAKIQ